MMGRIKSGRSLSQGHPGFCETTLQNKRNMAPNSHKLAAFIAFKVHWEGGLPNKYTNCLQICYFYAGQYAPYWNLGLATGHLAPLLITLLIRASQNWNQFFESQRKGASSPVRDSKKLPHAIGWTAVHNLCHCQPCI